MAPTAQPNDDEIDQDALDDVLNDDMNELNEEDADKAFADGFGEEDPEPELGAGKPRDQVAELEDDDLDNQVDDHLGDMTDEEVAAAKEALRKEQGIKDDPEAGPEDKPKDPPADEPDPVAKELADLRAANEALRAENEEQRNWRRGIDGRFGDINSRLQTLMNTAGAAAKETQDAGAAAPTSAQVTEAVADGEAMKSLREDFPEFAAALDERMAAIQPAAPAPAAEPAPKEDPPDGAAGTHPQAVLTDEIREAVADQVGQITHDLIEDAHEGWLDTVRSDDFTEWVQVGVKDPEALNKSDSPRDVIKALDGFKEYQAFREKLGDDADKYRPQAILAMMSDPDAQSTSTPKAKSKPSSNARLAAAAAPARGSHSRRESRSPEDAFEAGFKGEE